MIYAGLNNVDELVKELGRACEKKSTFIPTLPLDPKFARFHRDPRFRQLLEQLNFPRRVISPRNL